MHHPLAFLENLFRSAVAAAQPEQCLPPCLPAPGPGRTLVVGAGKAAARMAATLERHWLGAPENLTGLVVTAYGQTVPTRAIEVIEAAHPIPDQASERAALEILARVRNLTANDRVLALISGGGSSLLALPAPGLTLGDKRRINQALLRSGADIAEINTVRRHLSAIKGGRLAAACYPAPVTTLLLSDVPGDHPHAIASGPTVADPSTREQAIAILDRYAICVPERVRAHLRSPASETLKGVDPRLANNPVTLVASARTALQAAARQARAAGITAVLLGDDRQGEARQLGRELAGIAARAHDPGSSIKLPCVLLSGGETTVTVRGDGCGGRNVETLLAFGLALPAGCHAYALFADTDGIDGAADVAGAFWTPDTGARAVALRLDAHAALARNDAHTFFAALGDNLITGPTGTNVNDFRAVLVLPGAP